MKLSAARKIVLHLPTRPKSGLRHLSGDPLPPPPIEIVSLLKTTDHNDWISNSHLVEFLNASPSHTTLLKITRQLGSTDKALQFFEFFKAHSSSLSPSSISFTFQAILEQAMRDEKSNVPTRLFQLFSFSKDQKIPLSINAATLLIRCFGRAKMLEEMMSVYNELDSDSRNTNVVNLLLDCLFRGGSTDDGFKVLDEMLERDSGFPPNNSTLDIVLSVMWKRNWVGTRMSVEEICGLLVRFFERGVFLDDVWFTKLITMFCRSGKCDKAWDLLHDMMRLGGQVEAPSFNALLSGLGRDHDFQKMNLLMNEMKEKEIKPNVVTFGILINHLCKSYRVDEALQVFEKMGGSESDGILVKPDRVIYNTLIDGLCKVGKQEEGFKLMEKMRLESGYEPNTVTYNCLIDGFCKAGEIERSNDLFDQMKKDGVGANVITLNTLLDGMCKHGRVSKAMGLFAEMQEKGLKGNSITYTILITSFCSVNNIDKAMSLFNEMSENRCSPDAKVYYSLILGLCQAGRMDDASCVASKVKEAGFGLDIICYNALIGGLCRKNKIDEAHKMLKDMEESGIKPDRYTYNTLISYFSEKGQFSTAHRVMKRMIDDGYLPNVVTYGALINAYCLAGELDEAMKIFKNMSSATNVPPNTVIYNILIDTLCKSDKVEAAMSLLGDMKDKGVRPNTITYNALFKGLQERNWVEKAFEIMDQMTENACNPDYITMEVLTQWLSDIGEIEKLRSFVEGYEVSTSTA
ncbi:LOW QUALITY PROTEIN: pentatricopeptide repeat-containing protein At3g61520, mitochondrial [Lycium ferocissimum]|uniref:LOW QUALITY PROTEIN: pentatricopeptide repeat-containing protein At3g61520, mitochondrial n=1 Tax=Lycium ferocissimum TaxID=112874 RepID=UPI002815FDA7|nr:LOW QUALITY PROTEIN: pentatricopeptide repeat-containing protein At3g61520, mitochondrial [Lycium ferocissimum]